MNGFRLFRGFLAVLLLQLAIMAFARGDPVTALLAFFSACFGAAFTFGMADTDAKAGRSWRTAAPWGRVKADAFLVAMVVLVSVPIVLRGLE